MSSVAIFSANGVEARWNKGAAYTVTADNKPTRSYPTEAAAIRAAKRKAKATAAKPGTRDTEEG